MGTVGAGLGQGATALTSNPLVGIFQNNLYKNKTLKKCLLSTDIILRPSYSVISGSTWSKSEEASSCLPVGSNRIPPASSTITEAAAMSHTWIPNS